MKTKKLNFRGTTLIELAVIISIIFFLVVIGIVEYAKFDDKARREGSLTSAKALATALKMYKMEWRDYPPANGDITINYLLKYTDVTRLFSSFDTTTSLPINGVEIWTDNTLNPQPWCIFAAVKGNNVPGTNFGNTGAYNIKYCADTNDTDPSTSTANQPACAKDSATWYACKDKL